MVSHLYFYLFAAAFISSWLITGGVRRLALKLGVVAKRDARRRHDHPTPLLGGTAFYIVLVIVTLGVWLLGGQSIDARFAFCFIAALTLIYGVGVWDDCRELKALPKILIQTVAALLILAAEPQLPSLLQDIAVPQWRWLVAAAMVLWIVGVTNALNMIDGLDGLCAGITGISAFAMAMILLNVEGYTGFPTFITLTLAACCLGFLVHNFNPAKIFLGDSGSLLLGFVLAVVSVKVDAKRSLFVSLSLPIFVLGVPLIDVALSVVRRRRREKSVFSGDRGHIHHRLQQIGLSHRGAVLALWSASGYLNLVAYFLAQISIGHSIFVYGLVVPTLVFWFLSLYFVEGRLAQQTAQFGQLFVRHQGHIFADREGLSQFISNRDATQAAAVVILDSHDYLSQITHEKPARVFEFYLNLYSILSSRLRASDLVARVSEYRVAVILPGLAPELGSNVSVLQFMSAKIKALQENYRVFQSHSDKPEGYKVLYLPRDEKQIFGLLQLKMARATDTSDQKIA